MDLQVPPPPHRPFPVRLINGVERWAAHWTGHLPRLTEASLLEAARRKTGLSDLGGERVLVGLRELLRSLAADGQLNAMGRIMARAQIVHALSVRLQLNEYRTRHPEVAKRRIERPLFVLGLPRTGTTILYSIIAQDPAHRSPASWEVAEPLPPPDPGTYEHDPRAAKTDAEFDQFRRLVPRIDRMHPLGANLPQECLVFMGYDFHSLQYELCFNATSYTDWYLTQDLRPTYRFHREFLQILSSHFAAERWVLKSPQHLATLDALLAEYPDALVVQTHRDPVDVIPSVSSLHYALRAATSDALDPHAVGREQCALWARSLSRAMAVRDGMSLSRQFIDVQFQEIVRDAMSVVRRIYEHFGLNLSEDAEKRMKRYVAAHPRDKHGTHTYTPEMFGLSPSRIRADFADYCRRFGVASASEREGSHGER